MWKFDLAALDNPTSNVEIDQQEKIEVFPNPTNALVEVQLPSTEQWNISILNPLGQTIHSAKHNDNTFRFDMSNLAKGIYLFSFQKEGSTTIMKKVQKN